jgi:molybdopterin converting factor subunit 1
LKVLFFAQIRDVTGCAAAEITATGETTAEGLWSLLDQRFPGLEKFRSSTRLARNGVFAADRETFLPGDEVALIPPVSGG